MLSMKKAFNMKKIIVIIIFLLIICPNAFSFNMRIDTRKVKLEVEPNQVYRGGIRIDNPTKDAVRVRVYLEDFKYIKPFDGTKDFFPPGSTENACAKWISFSPQEFTLAPFAKTNVNYIVTVPKDVSGGYYAVQFFETALGEMPDPKSQEKNLLVKGRIGSLFLVETKDSIRKTDIEDISSIGNKIQGRLRNKGNTVLSGKGSFYVMDNKGEVFDRGVIKEMYLSSGDSTDIAFELGDSIPIGDYTLIISLDLGEGNVYVKEVGFSKNTRGQIETIETVK